MPTSDNRATLTVHPLEVPRREVVAVELADLKFSASGDPDKKGTWTLRGHAAVFNRKSHDLGGFRTVIAPGAFAKILDTNPDVHLVLNHDMSKVLARTRSNTLELREDAYGLHVWANVAPTSHGNDLRISMERGDVDQMSFACDIGEDEWTMDADENVTRTIYSISGLFDATVCAQGAFPQTNAQLVASMHDARAQLAAAIEGGKIIKQDPDLVASQGTGEDGDDIAPSEGVADVADRAERFSALRERAESLLAGTEVQ